MRPKKIFLLSIDCLRADHLSCYGYKRNTSPHIDKFASGSILFRWAFSSCPYTVPSHASMLTGKYPSQNTFGFANGYPTKYESDKELMLQEVLSSIGYETAAFVSALPLRKETGLSTGFKVYDDTFTRGELNRPSGLTCSGIETNQKVFNWLDLNAEKKFFLFIHYFDVHGPYTNPQDYKEIFGFDPYYGEQINLDVKPDDNPFGGIPAYQVLKPIKDEKGKLLSYEKDKRYYIAEYDGGIRYCDDIIDNLFNRLKDIGIYKDSLIIVTADHGEALGENNIFFYHGLTVTPDQISVPFLLKPHRGWNIKHRTLTIPISTLDIAPTILSLCDFDYSNLSFQGYSLKTAIEGKDDEILWDRKIISENEWQIALINRDLVLEIRKKQPPSSTYYPFILGLSDSLDEKKFRCDTGYEYELTLPFDQYQRYRIVADIVSKYRTNTNRFKILEVGAGLEENIKKFLPNDEIYFMDKDYPEEYKQRDDYIACDITKSDLEGEYDIVISIDCYEHITPMDREIYVRRLLRLSRVATIIAAPFDTADVSESEIIANELYRQIHGKDHRWLREHIQNGLPSLSNTVRLIDKQGMNHTIIPNGYLPRWFDMISVSLIAEGKAEFAKFVRKMTEFYNQYFYCYDNMKPAYRQVIIVSKTLEIPDFQSILSNNRISENDFAIKCSLLNSYFERFKDLCNTNLTAPELLRDKDTQIAHLEGMVREKGDEVEELRAGQTEKEKEIRGLKDTLSQKDTYIYDLEYLFNKHEEERWGLKETISQKEASLNHIYNSHGWKALMFYYRTRDKVLSINTKRRLFAKILFKLITYPKGMFKKFDKKL
jgi:arylsulfatase